MFDARREKQEFPADGMPHDLPAPEAVCSEPVVGGAPVRLAAPPALRVVDAKSGQPLGDVRVERLEGGYRPSAIPFVLVNRLSPAEKQTTNQCGLATFQKSGSQFMVNPSSDNPTYNKAYVKLTWSGAKVCYPGEYREFSVAQGRRRRDPLAASLGPQRRPLRDAPRAVPRPPSTKAGFIE